MRRSERLPVGLEPALREYATRLRSRFGARLRLVSLFGSWSRGEATEDSDVDVAVVVEELTRDEWREAISDAVEVELASGVVLSPYVVSTEHFDLLIRRERRLARDIVDEGMPL